MVVLTQQCGFRVIKEGMGGRGGGGGTVRLRFQTRAIEAVFRKVSLGRVDKSNMAFLVP